MNRIFNALTTSLSYTRAHPWRVSVPAVLILIATVFMLKNSEKAPEIQPSLRAVEIVAAADYAAGAGGVAVPTASGNAYVIRAEAGGKVTQVRKEGAVPAGTIIAQLENSSQRAALIQAEGVYEAALASSGGNETNQNSARQDGVRTWTAATVGATETLRTSIDNYYAEVRGSQGATGFRLQSFGAAPELNDIRDVIEKSILDRWEVEEVTEANSAIRLEQLNTDLATIGNLIDRITALIPRQSITDVYTEADRSADAAALATARASITRFQESVDAALLSITNASGTGNASANAQVKQALGALEAARASLAKTSVRTPFAGTVSALNVAVGDIITPGSDVAIVVPNEGVSGERSFALPLSSVKYTPAGAFVFIVNQEGILETKEVKTGLVTADAITATGLGGDEMIVKDVRGLKAGEKVQVNEG